MCKRSLNRRTKLLTSLMHAPQFVLQAVKKLNKFEFMGRPIFVDLVDGKFQLPGMHLQQWFLTTYVPRPRPHIGPNWCKMCNARKIYLTIYKFTGNSQNHYSFLYDKIQLWSFESFNFLKQLLLNLLDYLCLSFSGKLHSL